MYDFRRIIACFSVNVPFIMTFNYIKHYLEKLGKILRNKGREIQKNLVYHH